MTKASFRGQHFVAHLIKDPSERLNAHDLKNWPYALIVASDYVYAPMSKQELLDLSKTIKEFAESSSYEN